MKVTTTTVGEEEYRVIENGTQMPKHMIDFAFATIDVACKKSKNATYWAQYLQMQFNKKFPPASWNAIVGRDFSTEFFHRTGYVLFFTIGEDYRGIIFRLF